MNKIINDPEKATLTLYQGVLNDDTITILKDDWKYKGRNGAKIKIDYYLYANEWSNSKNTRYFKTIEKAIDWYKRNFTARATIQGACWLAEDENEAEIARKIENDFDTIFETLTKEEKTRSIDEWEAMTLYCEI